MEEELKWVDENTEKRSVGEGQEQADPGRLHVSGKHVSAHWLHPVLATAPQVNRRSERNKCRTTPVP